MVRVVGARVVAALALGRVWAMGGGVAHAANCTETEGSSIFSAYSAFQDSVSADCGADKCAQVCIDTQRLLSTALPDCVYVDGANYRQQVLDLIATCDTSAAVSTSAPPATETPTNVPVTSPAPVTSDSAVGTTSPAITEAPVALVTPSGAPVTTTSAPTATTTTATTDGSHPTAAICTSEQGDSILATYGTYQGNLSVACADDKCASACVLAQTEVLALLPDCQYADGTNYYDKVSDSLSSCGVATDDASYVPSTLPCSATQSNVTIILYSQYESELREACDADKCSADCISIVNQLTSVLPDCVYSDGINYHNESIGIIVACGNVSSAGSSSAVGSDSAASGVHSLIPALMGLIAVLAACL